MWERNLDIIVIRTKGCRAEVSHRCHYYYVEFVVMFRKLNCQLYYYCVIIFCFITRTEKTPTVNGI